MPQIHFNGKTYNDIAEMPATERQAYEHLMSIFEDKDQDGTPDIFQGDVVGNLIKVVRKSGGTGEGVEALEQMSPEMRARISKGVAKLNELGLLSQVPDLSDVDLNTVGYREQASSWEDAEIRPSKPIIPSESAIQEDSGSNRAVVIATVVLAVMLCLGGVVAYLLMLN